MSFWWYRDQIKFCKYWDKHTQKRWNWTVFLNSTWIDARTQNSANWEAVKYVDLVIFHNKVLLVKLSILHHGGEVFSNFFSTYVFRWKIIKEDKTTNFHVFFVWIQCRKTIPVLTTSLQVFLANFLEPSDILE